MLEARDDADFFFEAFGADGFGDVLTEDFHGDLTLVTRVVREEDGRGCSVAEFLFDPVAAAVTDLRAGLEEGKGAGALGSGGFAAPLSATCARRAASRACQRSKDLPGAATPARKTPL